jgi:hypothetical protein
MFATAARLLGKKGKPKMAPIELTTPPEQAQSITRAIFDVVREHGPLTISDVWEHVKVRDLATETSCFIPAHYLFDGTSMWELAAKSRGSFLVIYNLPCSDGLYQMC